MPHCRCSPNDQHERMHQTTFRGRYQYSLANLHNSNPQIRYSEARARFCRVQHRPEIVQALIDALEWEEDGKVRIQIALSLGSSRSERAVEPLAQMLTSEDPRDRRGALYGLSFTRQPAAVDYIIQALHDPDANIRSEAMSRLGHPHYRHLHTKVDGAITELLQTEQDEDVRETAQTALHYIRTPQAEPSNRLIDYI